VVDIDDHDGCERWPLSSYTSSGSTCLTMLPLLSLPTEIWLGVGVGGACVNKSLIFGGGIRGGPIRDLIVLDKSSLSWPTTAGLGRRSGEFLPSARLLKGAREGILEGLLLPMVEAENDDTDDFIMLLAVDDGPIVDEARGLRAIEAVGVFALGGGGPLIVALRLADGAVRADLVLAGGGGLQGVFARVGIALGADALAASSSSK